MGELLTPAELAKLLEGRARYLPEGALTRGHYERAMQGRDRPLTDQPSGKNPRASDEAWLPQPVVRAPRQRDVTPQKRKRQLSRRVALDTSVMAERRATALAESQALRDQAKRENRRVG